MSTSSITQKWIKTATTNIAYLEAGEDHGQPVFLFHGFPDSAYSFQKIIISLAEHGYKIYAPFLRGFAPTQILDANEPQPGQLARLGQDALDFFDALAPQNAIVLGQDWRSAIAEILAFSRPDAVKKLIKLNWYGIYTMAESRKAQGFQYDQLRNSWYIWMLNTPLGDAITTYDATGFSLALWKQWTSCWNDTQETLFASAKSVFQSSDFGRVVLSAYRSGMNPQNTISTELQRKIESLPVIHADTLILSGENDPVESEPLSAEAQTRYFTGHLECRKIPGCGHFIHHENPKIVVNAILS